MQDAATLGQPRASGALKGNGWGGLQRQGFSHSFICQANVDSMKKLRAEEGKTSQILPPCLPAPNPGSPKDTTSPPVLGTCLCPHKASSSTVKSEIFTQGPML